MTTQAEAAGKQPNRLINETSTYLLQHAYNPVDWYPWGEEALARARAENKPILLSVGYSACHWCHVMEHESFEDAQTAELMNSLFVCIKVDREERPDIDEIYMKSVQMLTGHGGWPMTVFLTPELKPFFAGTYFPPTERHGMPSFKRVLQSVATAWNDQREAVENSAMEITSHLSLFDKIPTGEAVLDHRLIDSALSQLYKAFDREFGGFGNAPKFPHAACISLAMRHANAHPGWTAEQVGNNREIVQKTLDEMAYGGIHDQLAGGFARYAVDRIWLVPHFEKMLYDNAQLARNYFEGFQLTGNQYWARVGKGILEFVQAEMQTPEGAFYSSLDADSEGVEGKYYVWTPAELEAILGIKDATWVARVFGVEDGGNFEHGTSVLHLTNTAAAFAKQDKTTEEQFWQRLDSLRSRLLEQREKRVKPGRDEKVLLSWNALMISAFVDGYRALHDRAYLAVAHRAADFILNEMYKNGRLLRTFGRGQAKLNAYLDDYAYFVQALLDLAAVDFDPKWLEHAMQLTETTLEIFSDPTDGSLFYTSTEHEQLIARTKSFYDTSTPAPTAVATLNLLRLSTIFNRADFRQRAEKILLLYAPFFERVPDQFAFFLCALDYYLTPTTEVAFVADPEEDGWEDILLSIHDGYMPNAAIVLKDASADPAPIQLQSPLLKDRDLVDGLPAVYVCSQYTCERPLTSLDEIQQRMSQLSLSLPVTPG
jgi:hypothetical protein